MNSPFVQLALAVGLGMLVGMQRERDGSAMAGVRTFALIALSGSLCAVLAATVGGWVVAAGMLGVVAMIVTSNLLKAKRDEKPDPGMTTEAAALVMFLVGVLPVVGKQEIAVVVTGAVALLLHLKDPLHSAVRRIGQKEVKAVMQFVLIALVILPVLPNEEFGPLNVLNPYKIWMMVVLIVGISLVAYAAIRLLGNHVGGLLAGILGGLVSSTATTVTYARKSRESPAMSALAASIILLASTSVFFRILAEVGIVAPAVLPAIAPPLLIVMAMMGALGAVMFMRARHDTPTEPLHGEPAELKTAIVFAALYAVILFAVALAKENFGQAGLYVVATVSGLTDMDAITLSTAEMIKSQGLNPATGWRLILVAAMANMVFKAGVVMMLAAPALRRRIVMAFAIVLVGAAAVLVLWPDAAIEGATPKPTATTATTTATAATPAPPAR